MILSIFDSIALIITQPQSGLELPEIVDSELGWDELTVLVGMSWCF